MEELVEIIEVAKQERNCRLGLGALAILVSTRPPRTLASMMGLTSMTTTSGVQLPPAIGI
jgi:hypothetical protein